MSWASCALLREGSNMPSPENKLYETPEKCLVIWSSLMIHIGLSTPFAVNNASFVALGHHLDHPSKTTGPLKSASIINGCLRL